MLGLLVKFGDLGRGLGVRSSKHDRGEDSSGPEGGAQSLTHGFSVSVPRRQPAAQFAVPGGGHSCQPGRQAALWRSQFGRGGPPESQFLLALSLVETSWAGDPHWCQA